MDTPDVEGATGYIDTNFSGKAECALQMLKDGKDFVYIHIEAPDECGHRDEPENKVRLFCQHLDKTKAAYVALIVDGNEKGFILVVKSPLVIFSVASIIFCVGLSIVIFLQYVNIM